MSIAQIVLDVLQYMLKFNTSKNIQIPNPISNSKHH